jgi:ring-1,2-phenylacetyl-CoA epoxidase subunit PaaE
MSLITTSAAETQGTSANQFFPLAVNDVRLETAEALLVTFDLPEALKAIFRFEPGQYLAVRTNIAGAEVRRSYSICAAVQDGLLRIAIKRASCGLFSNWAFAHLRSGTVLEVMPPAGRFGRSLSPNRSFIAFAAGSGITPVYSVIKSLLQGDPEARFTLFYGNRTTGAIMLRNELADLKDRFIDRFTLVYILSQERQDSDLLCGRIDRSRCRELLRHWVCTADIDTAFVSGPGSMASDVKSALLAAGFAEGQIRIERFTSGKIRQGNDTSAPPAQELCQVALILDGNEHHFQMAKRGESILKAGLHHGIDLRYGCQGGVCASCRAHLRSGEVEMEANYALEVYEIARGFILTCQSYPRTDEVVIDFDKMH